MVRKYVRTTTQQSWTEVSMKEAITKLRQKEMSFNEASDTYGIPKTTLFRRMKKDGEVTVVSKKGLGRFKPVFSEKQEKDLYDYISFMESRLFGLTIKDIQKLAYEFAVRNRIKHQFNDKMKMAGDDFVAGFKKRHDRLSLRSAEKTSAARAAGFNKVVVKTFFGLLESLMEKYNFPPK
ncbi:Uncharacterised protein r2_g1322 [Pycnogonum litorale]